MGARQLCISSLVVWSAATVSGCSLPTAVTGTADTGIGTMDAFVPGTDAFVPPGVDAFVPGVDAFVPPDDAFVLPGVDAFVPPQDMGMDAFVPPPDMGTDAFVPPIDAGPMIDASTPCDRAYGSAPNYFLCASTAASCTFYYRASSTACSDICGSNCAAETDNVSGMMCTPTTTQMCNHNLGDGICTCAIP